MSRHDKRRFWTKCIGYPVLALFAFVMAVHYTFPYHRLEKHLGEAVATHYDVVSVSIGPGLLPGHIKIRDLVLRALPSAAGDSDVEVSDGVEATAVSTAGEGGAGDATKAKGGAGTARGNKSGEIRIDDADIDLGLLALIGKTTDIGVTAHLADGKITGRLEDSSAGMTFNLTVDSLPLGALPGVSSFTGGAPLDGTLDTKIEISAPRGKWRDAEGLVELSCQGCTIGDGVTKIRPSNAQHNAFLADGITLPKLKLGSLGGRIDITKGVGSIKQFESKSPDGEIVLEGEIRFEDPFSRSQLTAYLRFKSTEELRRREPRMENMELMMAGQGKRPDGFIGVSIRGPLKQLKYALAKTSPVQVKERSGTATAAAGRRDVPSRPTGPSARPPLAADHPPPGMLHPPITSPPSAPSPSTTAASSAAAGTTAAPAPPPAYVEPPVMEHPGSGPIAPYTRLPGMPGTPGGDEPPLPEQGSPGRYPGTSPEDENQRQTPTSHPAEPSSETDDDESSRSAPAVPQPADEEHGSEDSD
ncbi:MAG: type II secretion system protein GspN [Pseudomonadota bacterium]